MFYVARMEPGRPAVFARVNSLLIILLVYQPASPGRRRLNSKLEDVFTKRKKICDF